MKKNIITVVNKLIPLLMAIITYTFIHSRLTNQFYTFLPSMLFIVLLILFYSNDFYNKVMKKEILILSGLFSVLLSYGDILSSNLLTFENTFALFYKMESFVTLIAYFNMIYLLLNFIMPRLYNFNLKQDKSRSNNMVIIFSLVFSFVLLCWFPYCLRFFPGLVTNDSIDAIDFVLTNLKGIDNHHPVFFTLLIYIPIIIGKVKFHSIITGIAMYTLIQMFIMASIFASTIVFLYKRKVSIYVILLVLLYYALMPMHALHSVTMWKDVIFAGFFVLLTVEMIKMVDRYNNQELTFKKEIGFIIVALLCTFFRNNAIYMLIIVFILCLFIFKKSRKVIAMSFGIIIVSYFLITGPGFKLFGVKQTETTEYVSIPLQQVARMVYKGAPITLKEEKLINKLVPIEIIRKRYRPQLVDTIKWHEEYNNDVLSKNKGKYLKLWLNLCYRNPQIALEAQAASTLGYWYPNVVYWFNPEGLVNEKYGNYITPKSSDSTTKRIDNALGSTSAIYNIEWNIALWLYVIIIFGTISFKKKKWLGIVPYLPLLGLWFTLIIATPVYSEFRYIYSAFTALPLLIIYPYLKK